MPAIPTAPMRFLQLARQPIRPSATIGQIPSRSFHSSVFRRKPTSTNGHTPPHSHAHPTTHPSRPTGSGSTSGSGKKKPSAHMVWYREIVPAMIPIFLISTTVFLSLSLIRTHLSHSRSLAESAERIAELEAQLVKVRRDRQRAREREKRERERILPLVVERVLQKVGVVGQDVEEEQYKEKEKEQPRLL